MKIGYKDQKLQDLCLKRAAAQKALGAACAKKLMVRLQALEAAAASPTWWQAIRTRSREIAMESLHLTWPEGWRLTFVPAHNPCPATPDGGIDWAQVTIVTIEYIGDYHD